MLQGDLSDSQPAALPFGSVPTHCRTRCEPVPNTPIEVPDGIAQLPIVLDSELFDRLTDLAARRGVEPAVLISTLLNRMAFCAEVE